MATKPTTLPEWASGGSADITEPTLLKKQTGWVVEAPPHNYFNWWQKLVWQWMVYLDAFLTDVHTWTQNQDFSGGLTAVTAAISDFFTAVTAVITDLTATSLTVAVSATLPAPTVTYATVFASGVTNVPGAQKCCWWKNADGTVEVIINAQHSSSTAWNVLTLPAGFRPNVGIVVPASINGLGNASLAITSGGLITAAIDGSASLAQVDAQFRFRADITAAP
jgi:hypothetical protein